MAVSCKAVPELSQLQHSLDSISRDGPLWKQPTCAFTVDHQAQCLYRNTNQQTKRNETKQQLNMLALPWVGRARRSLVVRAAHFCATSWISRFYIRWQRLVMSPKLLRRGIGRCRRTHTQEHVIYTYNSLESSLTVPQLVFSHRLSTMLPPASY